jgi:RNA polymerase I-specific transcription initiation factor RRN3
MALTTAAAPRVGGMPISTPIKTVVRRPTLVRKRDDTDFEDSRDETPSSPNKKTKVTFDDEVEVRVMDEWEKAPAIVREEVRRALERHSLEDDTDYDKVMEIYERNSETGETSSTSTLRSYTAALLSNVSSLDRTCSTLVSSVLQSEWTVQPDEYVGLYLRFLTNLVSAQGAYLGDVLRMLVGYLVHSLCITMSSINLP